jgi:hypothetical protein
LYNPGREEKNFYTWMSFGVISIRLKTKTPSVEEEVSHYCFSSHLPDVSLPELAPNSVVSHQSSVARPLDFFLGLTPDD